MEPNPEGSWLEAPCSWSCEVRNLTPCFFYCLVIVLILCNVNFKNRKSCLAVVAHALNLSTWRQRCQGPEGCSMSDVTSKESSLQHRARSLLKARADPYKTQQPCPACLKGPVGGEERWSEMPRKCKTLYLLAKTAGDSESYGT